MLVYPWSPSSRPARGKSAHACNCFPGVRSSDRRYPRWPQKVNQKSKARKKKAERETRRYQARPRDDDGGVGEVSRKNGSGSKEPLEEAIE